ncbi:MAG: hypothetical protein KOO63_11955 [Bacteroidales bacterium]|nr:hypothetical protein [Candidatus Latescibacterota bacterium]
MYNHVKTFVVIVPVLFCAVGAAAQLENQLFLAVDQQNYFEQCPYVQVGQVFSASLVLVNPINPSFCQEGSRPVDFVGGFECRLYSTSNVEVLGFTFPVFSIDVGSTGSHFVGYSEPVPVQESNYGRMVVLATVEVRYVGQTVSEAKSTVPVPKSPQPCQGATGAMYLGEARPFSSIEGVPAYVDADDLENALVAADCTYGEMLFIEKAVSTEGKTWEQIKAMYR